jgi:predicted lipid-binding transport protein (Tim44 family)
VGWLTQMGPVRHRVRSAGQVAAQHPAHGVGAAPHHRGDLCGGLALGGKQHHLVAGPGLGVVGGLVAAFQLGLLGRVQAHAQRRQRHDRPPCSQE